MSAKHRHNKSMGVIQGFVLLFSFFSIAWPIIAFSAPPYDVTVTFDPPSSGGPVDSYNFYIDDCAVTGPVGASVGQVISGDTFPAVVTADGSYDMCVRAVNVTGENPDPGPIATVVISQTPLPGEIENLDITVTCRDGGGAVVVCADSGVNVSVTVN